MKQHASQKLAAENAAGSHTEITALARLAGLPYVTTISARLGAQYGLSPGRPVADRLELYDLIWAVSSALNDRSIAVVNRTPTATSRRVEFFSFMPGVVEPVSFCVLATLDSATSPWRLHLSFADEMPDQAPATVLIVEDDEQIADLLCLLLRRSGLNPTVAKTGRAALETAQQNPPDVVLLDYDLPDMDGFAVLTRMKSNSDTAAIPVVFCSGHYEIERRALELGASAFVNKPLDLPDIVERLQAVLKHKS